MTDPIALDWHPSYRAHIEWALHELGILEPMVEQNGEITYLHQDQLGEARQELIPLSGDLRLEFLMEALAMADGASGLSTGSEAVERLTDKFGVDGSKARFESIREGHEGNLRYISDSAQHVAQRLSAQAKRRKFEWGS